MNLITELLDDPGFAAELRRRSVPLSLRDALNLLEIEPTGPERWAGPPAGDFEPAGPELLDVAQLTRFPASALPLSGDAGPPPPDLEHGPALWLEGRYLDPDRQEIAVFPNEDAPTPERVMLFAPGERHEDSVILDVASAELQVLGVRRRLLGLFRRRQRCPQGFFQPDQTFHCPPGTCRKGACADWTWEETSGPKHDCRCQ